MSQYTHRLRRMARTGAALLLASAMLLSACTGARRSQPGTPGPAGNGAGNSNNTPGATATGTMTHAGEQVNQFVKGLGVPNYRRSDTIVVGNVALIGLELEGSSGAGSTGGQTGNNVGQTGNSGGQTGNSGGLGGASGQTGGGDTAGQSGTAGNTGVTGAAGTGAASGTGATAGGASGGNMGASGNTGASGMSGMTGDPVSLISQRVTVGNLGVDRVLVTTAPDLVDRIRAINDHMARNQPATDYIEEIARIVEAIGPDNTFGPAGTSPNGNLNPGTPVPGNQGGGNTGGGNTGGGAGGGVNP